MSSTPQIIQLPNTLSSTPLREVLDGLSKPTGQRTLPTILLYDECGLRLYDDITTKAPEYYLFAAEEQILCDDAPEIIRLMHGGGPVRNGEILLELGAGALRKTSHLLRAAAEISPREPTPAVTYLALDLEKRELDRTLSLMSSSDLGPQLEGRVRIGGLCGTYDDGIAYVRHGGLSDMQQASPLLRASIPSENDKKGNAVEISQILEPMGSSGFKDTNPPILSPLSPTRSDSAGTSPSDEHPSSPSTLTDDQSTYSTDYEETPPIHFLFLGSSIGNFTRPGASDFLRSLPLRPWISTSESSETPFGDTLLLGLDHDNRPELIERAYNDPAGHTRKFIMNGLAGQTVVIEAGEAVHIEYSYKYSEAAAQSLFNDSNLKPLHRWTSANGLYSLWLLHRPSFSFPITLNIPTVEQKAEIQMEPFSIRAKPQFSTIPTLEEWEEMWKLWDTVTLGMIPPGMMMQKPIDLRHKCLFYLGHIPTFLDIHLSRLLQEPNTEPDHFKYIFERGIDPHVDDPTQCHPHSEVPEADDEWPSLESILSFRDRVRIRLKSVYGKLDSGELSTKGIFEKKAMRVLWMTYEHEAFHVETLLYMLLQKAGDSDGTRPPPGVPIPDWLALSRRWSRRLQEEKQLDSRVVLGPADVWLGHDDSEERDMDATLPEGVQHEFGWDNEHPKRKVHVGKFTVERRPVTNGEYYNFWTGQNLKTMPASWVKRDANVMVCTLFGPVSLSVAADWPLMASYEELDSFARAKGGRIPTEAELRLFMDDQNSRGIVNGYNNAGWGYQRWWPEPSSLGTPERNEAPHNGGVWEWTSTVMDHYEGYKSSVLYPGYSSDFFDGIHHVVVCTSLVWAPRCIVLPHVSSEAPLPLFQGWHKGALFAISINEIIPMRGLVLVLLMTNRIQDQHYRVNRGQNQNGLDTGLCTSSRVK
ncbi:hypothetical protein FRB91_005784 [Serendipita sp. 411]|nr:hypothetical protein FRB91_005784 [Serendipita sp. 411]